MGHVIVPEAEELLDKEFPVLDQGFVRLVDYMGGDAAIVQAARVSYGQGTTTKSQDDALIDYLMRHRHTSPFEMVELKFHVKMPIFVARQWIRHRTANVNEYSGRYSEMPDEFWMPEAWRAQDTKNKQGSDGTVAYESHKFSDGIAPQIAEDVAFNEYARRLDAGVSREMARSCLPLSTYTQWYWKIDLHNLLHFLGLRMDAHAQPEIKAYADVMGNEIVSKVVPATWASFLRWHPHMNGCLFGSDEMEVVREMAAAYKNYMGNNFQSSIQTHLTGSRMREFLGKIE